MKEIQAATRLAILLIFIASSIVAVGSSGATISAFAQQSVIHFELHDLPQITIPENTLQRRFDTVSSTSLTSLTWSGSMHSGLLALHRRN